ncbi:hypothetical protein DEV92_104270 [Phyllobacterium myrsinacearum]|jgi:hypothetical protein|nr:hypothetical protein DEV92_104270 [Phyllobacterium myrsinacearum]RZS77852.1 hypothetical protein EV217_4520 [Phyllobacterium myrsinacearum]RZV04800.1 hypothetical protein EV654_3605 [Phyllobacterium myrsinacearum]
MPILFLLPIAALICVWAAIVCSRSLRYPFLIVGMVTIALWLWYLFALVQLDLPA